MRILLNLYLSEKGEVYNITKDLSRHTRQWCFIVFRQRRTQHPLRRQLDQAEHQDHTRDTDQDTPRGRFTGILHLTADIQRGLPSPEGKEKQQGRFPEGRRVRHRQATEMSAAGIHKTRNDQDQCREHFDGGQGVDELHPLFDAADIRDDQESGDGEEKLRKAVHTL